MPQAPAKKRRVPSGPSLPPLSARPAVAVFLSCIAGWNYNVLAPNEQLARIQLDPQLDPQPKEQVEEDEENEDVDTGIVPKQYP